MICGPTEIEPGSDEPTVFPELGRSRTEPGRSRGGSGSGSQSRTNQQRPSMPKKGPKKKGKGKSAAEKKALGEAVAIPFGLGVDAHNAAEDAADSGTEAGAAQAAALLEAACGHYAAALTFKAIDLDTLFNTGTALLQWGALPGVPPAQAEQLRGSACDKFRQVVQLDTSQRSESRADALCNLLALLGTRGDEASEAGRPDMAEPLYAEACAMEAALPPDAAQGRYNLGQIYRARAALEAQPLPKAVQLLEASVRCFEAVLGMPPVDPPIDVDALMELASALLELAHQLAQQGPAGNARVPELVAGAAARCAAVEALDPTQAEFAMELKMDLARVLQGQGEEAAAGAAWSAAFAACEAAAPSAEGRQGADEVRALALYNASCVAALRTPADNTQARSCLTSAVEMALAAAAGSAAASDLDDSYVTVGDLQSDADLTAVHGCDWFRGLVERLGGSGGGDTAAPMEMS